MSNREENTESRRHFLKLAAGAAAVVAVGAAMPRDARAAELPALSMDDAMAKALKYVEDHTKTTDPKYKKGDDCTNCMFYQGKAGDARGPCQLFPGKSVNAKGWCVSHAPKKA
ncbi:MAG TPA: high-potential iron-sulfur protein [Rhodanobacteraceae bacterium]|nr:high-potential iron-sulfur protein [Rhodanobacteraceae bacterium]